MGGNAIKKSQRMSKENYQIITNKFLNLFTQYYPQYQNFAAFPPAFKEKESFGDIDFLSVANNLEMFGFLYKLEQMGEIKIDDVDSAGCKHIAFKFSDMASEQQKSELITLLKEANGSNEFLCNVTVNHGDKLTHNAILNDDLITIENMAVPIQRIIFDLAECNIIKTETYEKFDLSRPAVYSFGIQFKMSDGHFSDIHQLDFIQTLKDEKAFNFHLNYLSWNDLGNFIGRIAVGHGLSFGHDGLTKRLYVDEQGNELNVSQLKNLNNQDDVQKVKLKTEIFVSNDWDKVINFLGFDSERFKQGFNNVAEIADYVYDSKYFEYYPFDLDNRDNKSRARDLKRTNYKIAIDRFIERGANISLDKNENHDLSKHLGTEFPQYINNRHAIINAIKNDFNLSNKFKNKKIINLVQYLLGQSFEQRPNSNPELLSFQLKQQISQKFKQMGLNNYIEFQKNNPDISIHGITRNDLNMIWGKSFVNYLKNNIENNLDKDLSVKLLNQIKERQFPKDSWLITLQHDINSFFKKQKIDLNHENETNKTTRKVKI